MEEDNFANELQQALSKKQEWYNSECLQELLMQYRLLHTCVKTLYETFVKKSLITPDPYRLDKKISEIIVPETSPFSESDIAKVFGERFSNYETMMDYICTYFRFSIENFSIATVKKLIDFNKVFEWNDLSMNNVKMNTRALAITVNHAKKGAPNVVQSMINDSVAKSAQAVVVINKMLNELGIFMRELYKGGLRRDVFDHPEFDKQKAAASADGELAEIKRLYTKITGKKNLYTDLVNEIIEAVVSLYDEVAAEVGYLHALVAKGLAALLEALAGINQLHLALTLRTLVLGDHPDVSGNARVVEQVGGQLHDGLQPVVVEQITTDVALATAGIALEE